VSDLPPGFVVDQPANVGLPPGFVVDQPSGAMGLAKSLGSGAAEGAIKLAGMIPDISSMAHNAANKYLFDPLLNATIGAPSKTLSADQQPPDISALAGSANIKKGVEAVAGPLYQPQNTAEKFAHSVGEMLPGSLAAPGSLTGRLVSGIGAGLGAEGAGQATSGTNLEPYARIAGALAGGAAPSLLGRAITPLPASAARQDLVDTLHAEGVPLTAGQATGSKPLQWAESAFGDMLGAGGRPARVMENQGEQFTAAALRRAGENANRATPDVIDNAFTRIGNDFEAVARRNNVMADPRLGNDLTQVEGAYNNLVSPSNRAPVIANTIRDIGDVAAQNGGHLTGQQYNAMTSRLARQARNARTDPQLQEALQGVRTALDDAMERTLFRTNNQADMQLLRQARNQYRNLLVVEKAATGAGANAAEGLISPSQLRNAVVQQNRRSYARGLGDFADLARAGEGILKPLPNSGTAPRQNMQHALQTIGAVMGGAGGFAGGPAGVGAGALAGIAAPAVAGRALMSRPVQAYLGNQLLSQALRNNPTRQQALFQAAAEARKQLRSDKSR